MRAVTPAKQEAQQAASLPQRAWEQGAVGSGSLGSQPNFTQAAQCQRSGAFVCSHFRVQVANAQISTDAKAAETAETSQAPMCHASQGGRKLLVLPLLPYKLMQAYSLLHPYTGHSPAMASLFLHCRNPFTFLLLDPLPTPV